MPYLETNDVLCDYWIHICQFYPQIVHTFACLLWIKFPSDSKKCAVTKQCVRINVLKGILPELAEKSDVTVHYTNHSLRLTAITHVFNCGVPEKVIAENSGHRSTKALRCYERTSEEVQQVVTKVINNPTNPAISECTAFTFQQSSQSTSVGDGG